MSKFGRSQKKPPAGFDYIEPTLKALEDELRDRVGESHKLYTKNEAQWPIHQINWQKSRYVYDMYYKYQRIDRRVYEYCINNKLIDAALISKWKKQGYERLCSTYVINPNNYKFGTVSLCRVPKQFLDEGTIVEDPTTGCNGCASGPGGEKNIFNNKYGQYLAAIQVAREDRDDNYEEEEGNLEDNTEREEEKDESNANGRRNSSSINTKDDVPSDVPWADNQELEGILEEEGEAETDLGVFSGDAEKEARKAASNVSRREREKERDGEEDSHKRRKT